ncbi:hypothetical protein [Streptomyces sp. NPDC017202]|uniref:hypothetical protein n=1 Tax=Streptomyces sp. NPDC017202 TaxID=3364981 RepID=UPI00379CB963
MPVPESVRSLTPGTIPYRAATDLAALQADFENNPVEVLVELLRDLGETITVAALRERVKSMGLGVEMPPHEWNAVRESLRADSAVRTHGKYCVSWKGKAGATPRRGRRRSASEALRELAGMPRKNTAATRRLSAAVSVGLGELTSPYEQLAAHALGVPVTDWPQGWAEPRPQDVPEEVRLVAVQHITEMSRARNRAVLPATDPGLDAVKSAEIPSRLELLPLLVPLAAMPAKSLAADRAAKAVNGEYAWDTLRTGMECFELSLSKTSDREAGRPDQDKLLAPLAARARELLKRVLMRRPKEDDLPWLDFVEEMVFRACVLLADPRIQEQRNGLVREWAQHVADHSGIPAELREAARAAQAAAAAEAADAAETDGTGVSERATGGRQGEAAPEAPPVSAEEPECTEAEQEGDTGAEAGEADSAELASDEPVQEVTEDVPDEAPEAAQETERDPQVEIEALKRLLEEERSNVATARTESERQRRDASDALAEAEATANRLRLRIADEEKHRAEAETRARAAEATAESARQGLEEAEQRVEAMTRQLRRRDDELRQSRQTARGASQAQLRQARIDTLRVLAAVLTEVADQAIHEDDKTGPANALYRRALARAAAAGVLDRGALGEETDYDPVMHRAPGGPAARVVVERPGFVWQGSREPEPVVLEQAIVRGVEQ